MVIQFTKMRDSRTKLSINNRNNVSGIFIVVRIIVVSFEYDLTKYGSELIMTKSSIH